MIAGSVGLSLVGDEPTRIRGDAFFADHQRGVCSRALVTNFEPSEFKKALSWTEQWPLGGQHVVKSVIGLTKDSLT